MVPAHGQPYPYGGARDRQCYDRPVSEAAKSKAACRRPCLSGLVASAVLAAACAPAGAAPPVPAAAPAPVADCAAERAALQAEHAAVRMAIADVALGRSRPRRKAGAGDVGRAAAGAAASLLLPFGIGLAVNAAGAAASKAGKKGKKKPPPPPEADVPALIERQHAIEARLAAIAGAGCGPAPAAAAD
jgi:hypothetical protein